MSGQWADVIHNVLALRAKPEGGSEQVSQAIMGDPVQVLEEKDGYARVQCQDGYDGWALRSQLRLCAKADCFVHRYEKEDIARVTAPFADVCSEDGELITRIVFGTRVHVAETLFGNAVGGQSLTAFLPNGTSGRLSKSALGPGVDRGSVASLAAIARQFLGTPYLWGGTTPFGFDCSGLVQRIYSTIGVTLPRDAYQQAVSPLGKKVPEGAPLRSGDLIFFLGERDPRKRGITHTGMMIDAARMIHAHGKSGVTIEALHGEEITAAYTYRGAWRLN